jgi:hypothetical protein
MGRDLRSPSLPSPMDEPAGWQVLGKRSDWVCRWT